MGVEKLLVSFLDFKSKVRSIHCAGGFDSHALPPIPTPLFPILTKFFLQENFQWRRVNISPIFYNKGGGNDRGIAL